MVPVIYGVFKKRIKNKEVELTDLTVREEGERNDLCSKAYSEALRASARGGPMWWVFALQDGLLLTHFISRPGDAHFCRAQYWVCQHLGPLMSQVCFPEQRDCSADTDLSRHTS